MTLNAGRLNNRIEIWRATRADDGKGDKTTVWTRLSTVWAEVIGQSGREAVIAHALQGISVFKITVRARTDVTVGDQIRYGAIDLNIKSVNDPDGTREALVILADTASVQAMPSGD